MMSRRGLKTIVAITFLTLAMAQVDADTGSRGGEAFADTSEAGWLFVAGEYVKPPYHVKATRDEIRVNEVTLPAIGTWDWEVGSTREDDSYPTHDDQVERPFRRRRRIRGPAHRREGKSALPSLEQKARQIAQDLQAGGFVVVFENQPVRTLIGSRETLVFCEALTAETPTKIHRLRFEQLGSTVAGKAVWAEWFRNFQPDASLSQAMKDHALAARADERQVLDQVKAEDRLQQYSYPFTIFGMLLGVGSLAHLLRWSKVGFLAEGSGATTDVRLTVLSMVMISAMSLFDLAWTLMAFQAGVMAEVNPIAERFIGSPSELALFKVAMTGVGLAILYFCRRSRFSQQASWLICFVCTLLTFRWVVFDSLLR